jgi:hypothetical protein
MFVSALLHNVVPSSDFYFNIFRYFYGLFFGRTNNPNFSEGFFASAIAKKYSGILLFKPYLRIHSLSCLAPLPSEGKHLKSEQFG